METAPKDQTQNPPQKPAVASCRRKVKEDATFFEDVKDHIDEFIHASMDEHKTCFQKTISKVPSFSTLSLSYQLQLYCFGSLKKESRCCSLNIYLCDKSLSCLRCIDFWLQAICFWFGEHLSLSPNLKKLLGIDYQMFGLSKAVAEKQAEEAKGVESQLPLQTTVSD